MSKSLIYISLFFSILSFSQESNWSIEANYPYTFGDNRVDEGYNGAADLGLNYRIAAYEKIDLGASLNIGAFLRDDNRFDNQIDASGSAFLFQPRVFASFKLDEFPEMHPMIGLGYSFFVFNRDDVNFAGATFQENASDDGINVNAAIAYDVSEKIYLQIQYDYIRLRAKDLLDAPFNKNVNIIKIGVGYRW